MAFFLIVPSVMMLCIVLVHGAAAHFGLQLKYKSLFLSAVASLAISFAAIKTSPFFGKIFLLKLGILVLAVSVACTAFNVFLLRREAGKVKPAVKPRAPRVLETERLDDPIEPPSEALAVKMRVAEIKSHRQPLEKTASKSLVKMLEDDKQSAPSVDKTVAPSVSKEPVEPTPEPPVKSPEPPSIVDSEPIKAVEPTPQSSRAESPAVAAVEPPVKDKTELAVEKKVADLVTANEKISAVFDKSKSEKAKPTKSSEHSNIDDELAEIESHLHSLSEILDFAYNRKENGDFKLAILAYQKALERYRADDYAPFIAIDLSSIYKEQAAYSKAIKVCEEALNLPAVAKSSSARKEFSSTLAYLRTVQSVLSRHRVLSTPFSKISRQLLAEIDADFKKLDVLS